jgi:hypothetical protein
MTMSEQGPQEEECTRNAVAYKGHDTRCIRRCRSKERREATTIALSPFKEQQYIQNITE